MDGICTLDCFSNVQDHLLHLQHLYLDICELARFLHDRSELSHVVLSCLLQHCTCIKNPKNRGRVTGSCPQIWVRQRIGNHPILSSRKGSSLSFAVLAICMSSAHAYSHVADALRKKYPLHTLPLIIVHAFLFLTDSMHLFTSGVGFCTVPCICLGHCSSSELVRREENGHNT